MMRPRSHVLRKGFSIVELLVVLTIMGILVRFGLPKYWELRRQATARAVIGDILAVRMAAYNYNTEKGTWPADVGAGTPPPELVTLLPTQFPFNRPDWILDWDVWSASGGLSGNAASNFVVGVAVDSPDAALVAILRKAAANMPTIVSGSKTTFLIAGIGGNY
jgi:prepilin-type N-terminal cleavage/methylation domain-containing protein